MIYYIYSLSHPITNEIRYIGKTINLKRRYKQHLYDKRHSYKASWVKSILKENLKPILTIIEECNENNWREREIFWISQFNNLTNLMDGGGSHYVRTTKEETKKKISLIHKGKKLTDEHKTKISNSMKKKRVIINGIIYESTRDASRKLKISNGSLIRKLKNPKYQNYQYLTN